MKMISGSEQCQHQPKDGTVYTTTGLPGDLMRSLDYPLEAVCLHCGTPIRCEHFLPIGESGEWRPKYPAGQDGGT